MEEVDIEDLKRRLPEILEQVHLFKRRFAIMKKGKLFAIIAPDDDGPDHDENAPVSPDPLTAAR